MPWPNLEAAKAARQLRAVEAESYMAQLYLRNHLNGIHQKVYGVGQQGRSLEDGMLYSMTSWIIPFGLTHFCNRLQTSSRKRSEQLSSDRSHGRLYPKNGHGGAVYGMEARRPSI
jgi:hypothetical protein